MKKVDIITLHHVTNFGSMLQTYATQYIIEKLGDKAEIIDFVPEGLTLYRALFPKNEQRSWFSKCIRFLPKLLCNSIQYVILNKFLTKYIHLSDIKYSSYEQLLENPPKADIYMSGSDQIWNTQNSNKENDLNAYYLQFAPKDKRKIAYAGSFGRKSFSAEMRHKIQKFLQEYDMVSVRESYGLEILKTVGIDYGVHVLDPTLLLNRNEWGNFIRPVREKKYLFVYNLNRNPVIKKYAQIIANEKQLAIVNFSDTFEFIKGAKNRLINGPEDFVSYIAHAEYVITDSFHGTAFSINFNKQFVCVRAPKYNSRLESILNLVGLNERLFKSEIDLEIANKAIIYSKINKIIDENRRISIDYLRNALEG